MARSQITVTESTHDGVTLPAVDTSVPADDHEIPDNDGRIIVVAENVSGSTRTIVVLGAATYGTPAIPLEDRTTTINAGARATLGPWHPLLFNQTGDLGDASVLLNVDGSNGDVEFTAIKAPFQTT